MIKEIDKNLSEALIAKIITDDEAVAIKAKEKGPGKFYELFKVHNTIS